MTKRNRYNSRKLNRSSGFYIGILLFAWLFASCSGSSPSPPQRPSNPTPTPTLSPEEEAEAIILQYLGPQRIVSVNIPYTELVPQKVVCHGDPEFQGCYEDRFSATGYSKDIQVPEHRSRVEKRPLPPQVSWIVEYDDSSEQSEVIAEFSLDDIQDAVQRLKWYVNHRTGEVTEEH